ncbi:MAG: hypothetical protein M3R25_15825, partial [Bacteroidota bacterium]|nr:hypothetical protein [Bacteroidota bacterium]
MPIFDDLQNELDRLMHDQNSHGLQEFEWYSPFEMQAILYSSFSPASPVQLRSMEEQDYQRVPLLNQARYMMEKIRQSGEVKLTDKGFLPTAVVKDIHSQGFIKEYFLDEYKKGKVI